MRADLDASIRDFFYKEKDFRRFDLTLYLPAASRWILEEACLLFYDATVLFYYHPHETHCFILIDQTTGPNYRVWSVVTLESALRIVNEAFPEETAIPLRALIDAFQDHSFPIDSKTLIAETVV